LRKESLPRLRWREVTQALDDPAPVEAVAKFHLRLPQLLRCPESPHPEQLLLSVRMNRSKG